MNSHLAGNDLSAEIKAAPHGTEVFERVEIVGELYKTTIELEPSSQTQPPALVTAFLSIHPHPVSVHFPIALCVTAVLFTIISISFNSDSLRTAAFYNLCCTALALPVAISTGLLSQRFNYCGRWNRFLRWKLVLSLVFSVLLAAALIIRLTLLNSENTDGLWYWIYNAIVIGLAPVIASIGYLGGRITFPR
jgi:uncharacterized membrane protein